MLFFATVAAFCFVELFGTSYIFWGDSFDINLVSATLVAFSWATSENTQRDRSVAIVVSLWWLYCLITDKIWSNEEAISIEASVMTVWVFWAIARPYTTPSQEIDPKKVCIAFYHGDRAPLLSSLSALIGLPFASVGVLAGTTALRVGNDGKLMVSDARAYDRSPYHTIINTGVEANQETFQIIANVSQSPVKFGPFRIGCIKAMRPVLDHIGLKPKTIFHYIPSIFYYQVARAAK